VTGSARSREGGQRSGVPKRPLSGGRLAPAPAGGADDLNEAVGLRQVRDSRARHRAASPAHRARILNGAARPGVQSSRPFAAAADPLLEPVASSYHWLGRGIGRWYRTMTPYRCCACRLPLSTLPQNFPPATRASDQQYRETPAVLARMALTGGLKDALEKTVADEARAGSNAPCVN